MSVAIIGSGFAGVAAGQVLADAGVEVEIFEAKPHWGGHTHTDVTDGFTFEEGPHVSFTKDEEVRAMFRRGTDEIEEIAVRMTNYFRGTWVAHPAQCHLYGLDPALVTACIVDLVEAQQSDSPVANYADWCIRSFGRTFSENFPFAYTRKYWTVEAAAMSTDWIGQRMYPPKLSEVVRGAVAPDNRGDFYYLSQVRYPRSGGYQSFMRGMLRERILRLRKRVVRLDLEDRSLTFADGTSTGFDRLISTMPLPELIRVIEPRQVPREVSLAADALLCTSMVLVDIAVVRPDLFDAQWFYVYDDDISFSRAHFPHMFAAANAPPGRGSIQVEVYHSRYRPLETDPASLPERVVAELVRMGVLRRADEVLWARHREVPYANVVFDHQRSPALSVILPWFKGHDVLLAGRYAEWGYHWTDDATRSGWAAAAQIVEETTATHV